MPNDIILRDVRFTLERFYGKSALGHGLICLDMVLDYNHPQNGIVVWWIAGKLFSHELEYITDIPPAMVCQNINRNNQHLVNIEIPVQFSQIRLIDEHRNAAGGTVWKVLLYQIMGNDRSVKANSVFELKVNGSDWIRILKEMKFEDRASFDIPVEGGRVQPPLDKAAAHMRAALDRVQLLQWDDALTKCREVLTELQQFQPAATPPWADWADSAKRQAWPLLERVMAAQAALRHATHAGAHASIGGASEHEVRLIVTMTAAILKYYASR